MSVKFVSAILGPAMAAPILWTPGKMRSFCRKNLHVHKILRFGGGGLGGGECRFYFYGREDFSEPLPSKIGHFLRGRSLKGGCNICVYVPLCVCVCSCVCPSSPPHDLAHTVGLNGRIPPTPEKAVAVSGVCSGVPEENSRKVLGK